MDFLQLVMSRQSDRAYDKVLNRKSWNGYWKLLVWHLQLAMHSRGSLWWLRTENFPGK